MNTIKELEDFQDEIIAMSAFLEGLEIGITKNEQHIIPLRRAILQLNKLNIFICELIGEKTLLEEDKTK